MVRAGHGPEVASALALRACYFYLRDERSASEELLRALLSPFRENEPLRTEVDVRLLARAIKLADGTGMTGGLALRLGAVGPTKVLGLVGDLVVHCSTLGCAASAARRFLHLVQPGGDLQVLDRGVRTLIAYEPPQSSERTRRFAIEFALSLIVSVAHELLGRSSPPKEVLAPFAAPAHADAYRELFACPVTFGANVAAVAFDTELFELRQLFADADLQRTIEIRLERITRPDEPTPFHAQVYGVLERESKTLLAGRTADLLASRLGLTPRVLRRRLGEEDTSLSRIVDDFCREKAIWMIVGQGLPLKVVADRLGFSEVSAFNRAFRRWTGVSPGQFRKGKTTPPPPLPVHMPQQSR